MRLLDTRADCARVLALELVAAVRAFDRQAVKEALDVADLPALAVVLAAMVDEDRTERELLGWLPEATQPLYAKHKPGAVRAATSGEQVPRVAPRVPLLPCGTRGAYVRHKGRGEPVDEACAAAERVYQREAKRRLRADAASTVESPDQSPSEYTARGGVPSHGPTARVG